jgi:hypothetical protein
MVASRRLLTSVADGTARAFANRSNDVDGWWVPGLLLRETVPSQPDYSIDLIAGMSIPSSLSGGLGELGPAWARYFTWTLGRHAIPVDRVLGARLSFKVDRAVEVPSHFLGNSDHPFVVTVRIDDDLGLVHERSVGGHCSQPEAFIDPNPDRRPRRSAPYDPGRIDSRIRD